MHTITELHDEAMTLAEQASVAKMRGYEHEAMGFLQKAYIKEKEAARLAQEGHVPNPTRSVLLRSAASLAIDCGNYTEASELIDDGIRGSPTLDIAKELKNLRKALAIHKRSREASMAKQGTQDTPRMLIGVLSSHDSREKNDELRDLFNSLCKTHQKKLDHFHFVFTGGTLDRMVNAGIANSAVVNKVTRDFLMNHSTILPDYAHGGVTVLANLIVQRQCSIVWLFLSPSTTHWLNPENLALMRLCDVWKAKRLMNTGSAENWLTHEADLDANRSKQKIPLQLASCAEDSKGNGTTLATAIKYAGTDRNKEGYWNITLPNGVDDQQETSIALIAHDEMKERIVAFAIQYEDQLTNRFSRILATEATGQQIEKAARRLKGKISFCRSGPDGGDIEIATKILFNRCGNVVFFVDPLHPHPHIDDIRTVFAACMRKKDVRIFTNEEHARRWMDQH
jgi:methylglyoxal synthase